MHVSVRFSLRLREYGGLRTSDGRSLLFAGCANSDRLLRARLASPTETHPDSAQRDRAPSNSLQLLFYSIAVNFTDAAQDSKADR